MKHRDFDSTSSDSRVTGRMAIAIVGWLALTSIVVGAPLQVGDPMPPLHGGSFEGSLPALRGKVVILDFWASWCGPCRKSFPALDALYKRYKDRGVVLVGINEDEKKQAMDAFLAKHPVSFPIIRDVNHGLIKAFGAEGMPTSIVVNPDGRIVSRHIGFRGAKTIATLEAEIRKLLQGKD